MVVSRLFFLTYFFYSCQYGLAIAPETTDIMSWLVVSDAVKLLTGHGQPINNTNLDEVIRIVADSQMD